MTFNFTDSQSSCIASATVYPDEVVLSFQSNPDRTYTFACDNVDEVVNFLSNPNGRSIGQQYQNWIARKTLVPVEELAIA